MFLEMIFLLCGSYHRLLVVEVAVEVHTIERGNLKVGMVVVWERVMLKRSESEWIGIVVEEMGATIMTGRGTKVGIRTERWGPGWWF